jgi:ribosomal protein S12 methylthiotransferase
MKRGVKSEQVRGILDRLREEVPGIAVRSTLITGFPGETDQDFEELKQLVLDYKFERLGVFTYSREETTPAFDMADQVPAEVAEARAAELMALQQKVMREFHEAKVGETLDVLVDGYDEHAERMVGRTYADAPEVDGRVLLAKDSAKVGDLVRAKITSAGDYEWTAEVSS